MNFFKGAYIGGRFRKISPRRGIFLKLDPGNTKSVLGKWGPTLDQVDNAVEAARNAFREWSALKISRRIQFLKRLRTVFRRRRKELAEIISAEMGKPLAESEAEVRVSIAKFDITFDEGLPLIESTKSKSLKQYYRYLPRGVLAVLGPFNFPLHLPNGNFVPALATGNTIIFKPSELTPFTGQMVAECFHEAGFPKGVFNLVQGGGEVGAKLVQHSAVNGILFVGSDETGRKILKTAHEDPKKICALEMGGKNATLIFPDADLKRTVQESLYSAFATTGQRCTSLGRIIVHRSVVEEFLERFLEGTFNWKIGHFTDPEAKMGPLVNEVAVKRFLSYQRKAKEEGIKTILEGKKIKSLLKGYYVSPSIHLVKKFHPRKEQTGYLYDEIFGPDVAIYTFDNFEEAVKIHNDCRYGLVASLYTKKKGIFKKAIQTIQVGNLFLNRPTIGASSRLPFGGIKASGNGFPAGLFSSYYCTYPVAIQE